MSSRVKEIKNKQMLHKKYFLGWFFIPILLLSFSSCIINDNIKDTSVLIDPGNDPNFTIVVNTDDGYTVFNRKVVVFNIPVYAFSSVDNTKLLHVANVLAQYLDNDEDGVVDNLIVHDKLKANNAFLYIWNTDLEKESFTAPGGHNGKNIATENINISWLSSQNGVFDTSIKTIWSFIADFGYEDTYPSVFGNQANSELSIAMDEARGGNFQNPPATYPATAWYTNSDINCNYNCQLTTYNYWVLSSMLGFHDNRLLDIEDEWKLNTSDKVQTEDVKAWAIFTNANYNLPTVSPDGTYLH